MPKELLGHDRRLIDVVAGGLGGEVEQVGSKSRIGQVFLEVGHRERCVVAVGPVGTEGAEGCPRLRVPSV